MADLDKVVSHYSRPNGCQRHPDGTIFRENVLLLNGEVLPNAPYFTLTWYCSAGDTHTEEHVHDFDEYVGFAGSDPDDPTNLNGEVRFMIDGEWVDITTSTILFIPAGMKHCPYEIVRCDKPIIHWSGGNAHEYGRH